MWIGQEADALWQVYSSLDMNYFYIICDICGFHDLGSCSDESG